MIAAKDLGQLQFLVVEYQATRRVALSSVNISSNKSKRPEEGL